MKTTVVDKSKCSRDGLCIKECPMKIIETDSDGFPYISPNNEKFCIHCGHCVAICPKAAFTVGDISPSKCLKVNIDNKIDSVAFESYAKRRRSIRTYKKIDVEKEKITRLINIASYAPSGLNQQPVKWIILDSTEIIKKTYELIIDFMKNLRDQGHPWYEALNLKRHINAFDKGEDSILLNAPCVILNYSLNTNPISLKDCIIAMTYLELAVHSMNLGACWAGYFEAAVNLWKPLKEFLEIPEDHSCNAALMVGYPMYKYLKIPPKNTPNIKWLK